MGFADELLARAEPAYRTAADPARAAPMAAYMRHQFPFLGLAKPDRAPIDRAALAGLPAPTDDDLAEVAQRCWAIPERELQYLGCFVLGRYAKTAGPALLGTARKAITTRSWWDTVDALASHVVGPLVRRHPELGQAMDAWVLDDDLWVARAAILHQLGARQQTDVGRLFAACAARAGDTELFLRKAIGWALRDYARTDPAAVAGFVAAHEGELSGLSKKEALKHIKGPTSRAPA